jgi:hypothetical protein
VLRLVVAALIAVGGHRVYRLLASGALTIDVGVGRRVRSLGPVSWEIAAPRELVFDVIASPYLGRTPQALADKLQVWETVLFDRPERIDFRVVRGPAPHVVESFVLDGDGDGTRLTWAGELGTDFWALGAWWGDRVARAWENAVRSSLDAIAAEAERRA